MMIIIGLIGIIFMMHGLWLMTGDKHASVKRSFSWYIIGLILFTLALIQDYAISIK